MDHHDLVVITENKKILSRIKKISDIYEYSFESFSSADAFAEKAEDFTATFVVLAAVELDSATETAGLVQVVKQFLNNAFILTIVNSRQDVEGNKFVKRSGSNMVLLEEEFHTSSKLEFAASQKIRTAYVPVKSSEFIENSTTDFPVYHMMTQAQKFLPAILRGTIITDRKIAKLKDVGEIYIRREDINRFNDYLLKYPNTSAVEGLKSRCRAQFMMLTSGYTDLALLLTDRSEVGSYELGRDLFDRCRAMAGDLLNSLGSVGEAWDIINNAFLGDFGSVERAPSIASYAGLFSLICNIGDPETIMISVLLADLGLLDLDPEITECLRRGRMDKMRNEQKLDYQKHPITSLNLSLSRKLPIDNSMKQIIVCTHERSDGKGFPNSPIAEKIPIEAQLIHFCELLDRASFIQMGKERISPYKSRIELYRKEKDELGRFGLLFLEKLKTAIE